MKLTAFTNKSWMIGVPSIGRGYFLDNPKRGVFRYFPKDQYADKLVIFTNKKYAPEYRGKGFNVFVEGEEITNIAESRQNILEYAHIRGIEYLFLADDDILLDHRRDDVKTKFRANYEVSGKTEELLEICLRICGEVHPLVHPRIRFHANTARYRYEKNSAAIRFVCIHVPTIMKEKIDYLGNGPVMEDRYFQHCLLEKGYETIALGRFVVGDWGSGRDGGCSNYRTIEMNSESAKTLHKRFPETVKLKIKTNGAWDKPRYDVTQYLKKYLPEGVEKYIPKEIMEQSWEEKYES